jgi:transposase
VLRIRIPPALHLVRPLPDQRVHGLDAVRRLERPAQFLEQPLVPTLRPGDLVVMDNLSSHKGPRVAQLIRAAGAELVCLPPYSPDLNPIELAFSKIKASVAKSSRPDDHGLVARRATGPRSHHTHRRRRLLSPLRLCDRDYLKML